jgi:hypothetical protein
MRCPFLRTIGPDGRLGEAQKTAVPTHRCAAFGDPLPLSLRQQELVCLQRVHVSCPRYVRGTLLANENQSEAAPGARRSGGVPILTVAGIGLVILALGILFTGLTGLPPFGGGSARSAVAVAPASGSPTTAALPKPTAAHTATASPAARTTPTPTLTPTPTPTPTPTLTPTPAVSASWPPGATAMTMNLVVPCPGEANCYIYTVRGPGPSGNGSSVADTLPAIAKFFGVDENVIYTMNPWARAGIKPGDKLKIPPPTR